MKKDIHFFCLLFLIFGLLPYDSQTAVLLVNKESQDPTPPFATWETAARTIQDAIDAASTGDTVLVTNGFYDAGGRLMEDHTGDRFVYLFTRVAITSQISVLSVNGPEHTFIYGTWDVRCVWITNGAILAGFTLTNGHTVITEYYENPIPGGGVCGSGADSVVSNCVITGCETMWAGGGAARCSLINCKLINNTSSRGGGAINCELKNCELINNRALSSGGGAYDCVLQSCYLVENTSNYGGGGAANSYLTNCTVGSCSSYDGGGAMESVLSGCIIKENHGVSGGGVRDSFLYNCLVVSNIADAWGGGALASTLINCTVVRNVARNEGGGIYGSAATNSIIYYNVAASEPNYASLAVYSCCVFPLPDYGGNNITNEPAFVDMASGNYRLKPDSPCIDSGDDSVVIDGTKDLDGKPRIIGAHVDLGAYEFINPSIDTDGDGMSDEYEWTYGLNPYDSSDKDIDFDSDGATNWQEFIPGTSPVDPQDVLKLRIDYIPGSNPAVVLAFTAVANRNYAIQKTQNIFANWQNILNIDPAPTNRQFVITNRIDGVQEFFRVMTKKQ